MTDLEVQLSDQDVTGRDATEQMRDSETDVTDITTEARGVKQAHPRTTPRFMTIPIFQMLRPANS